MHICAYACMNACSRTGRHWDTARGARGRWAAPPGALGDIWRHRDTPRGAQGARGDTETGPDRPWDTWRHWHTAIYTYHIRTCIAICIYAYMSVYMHIHVLYMCMYVGLLISVCMGMCTRTYDYIYSSMRAYAHLHMCTYASMHV